MAAKIKYGDKPWLKHYPPGVQEHLEYDDGLLHEFMEQSAAEDPDGTALIFQGYRISFRELNEMSNRVANGLRDFGVKKGDAVSILLPNLIPCVAAHFGILKIGAVVVMNNPLYTNRELEHQFNDSESKVLITLDLLANRMIDLRPETRIDQIIYTSIGDYLPFPQNLLFKLFGKWKKLAADVKAAEKVYTWKSFLSRYPATVENEKLTFEDVALYQYTGGTTGVSKGVMLTHGNMSKQVQQIKGWFPGFKRGEEIMLGALPFFHVFGLSTSMNFAVYMGWANVLVPKPQPEQLLEAISKFRPSFAPLVPTMYNGILNHPKFEKTDLSSIKGCFSGSAPLPLEVLRTFEEKSGAIIVEGFGMTETSPFALANPISRDGRKIGSIGLPVCDTEARIVDLEDGSTDVEMGEIGELMLRGPQVMRGYLNRMDETHMVLSPEGWLRTGDIAKMDEEGYFYIVDRKKDMIISGGYNVYPRDIEEVLYEHPQVREACAVGIPHPHRGEAVKVFVVVRNGEEVTEDILMEWCKERLAKYKWPVEIEFREDLPKTNVGKILRRNLKDEEQERRASGE